MKRWTAATAAVVIAMGGLIVTQGSAQASSSAWYQVYQADAHGFFSQTAAISQNNIWSVGDTFTATGKTIYKPLIRHYDGRSWQAVTIPGASGFTTDWVSASAANNVWVGGLKNSRTATSVVYRWNGVRWSKIPLPAMTALASVTVLSPNNVWAYAASGTISYNIFHWNGRKWQYYLANSINCGPEGMSASGPKNVWVSGYAWKGSKQVVAAYRWNGRKWHSVKMPHPVNYAGPTVTAVSPSNVWIGWSDTSSRHALHWDGHQWHSIAVPSDGNIFNIVPDGNGGYWFGPMASLTGGTWVLRQVPVFTGSIGAVTRIPGTASFLMNAGAAVGDSTVAMPTIFRFDL